MNTFQIPFSEDKERPDIYKLIKSKNHSPQTIIDFIKDHQMMHFETADLSEIFNFIILFCFSTQQEQLAKYIFDEFKQEIEISWLVFKLMEYRVDAVDISPYFDEYGKIVEQKAKMLPSSIFIKAFKEYKDNKNIEYFEMVMDSPNVMKVIKTDFLPTAFTGFQRRMFMQPVGIELFKILIAKDSEISDIISEQATSDMELLAIFFPQVADLFLF